MKKRISTALGLFACLLSFGQQTTLSDVGENFSKTQSGTMYDSNHDVDGYFFFYMADKLKKGQREYAIKVLDNGLNEIANKSYVDSKNTGLLSGKFNNDALMFLLFNRKDEKYKLVSFNKKAEQQTPVEVDLSKRELKYLEMVIQQGLAENILYPVDNKGFLFSRPLDNKKLGYAIKYLPTDGGKAWEYKSPEKSDSLIMGSVMSANEKFVAVQELTKKGLLSKKLNVKVKILDINTGEQLYQLVYEKKEDPRLITNIFFGEDKAMIVGEYFDPKDNIITDDSKGIFMQVFTEDGKLVKGGKVSWEKEIEPNIPADADGEKRKVKNILFHNVVKTQNGDYYVIGEDYKKTLSALGMLSNSNSKTQLTIEDAYIFRLDENFGLKNIEVFDKGKSRIPSITDYGSAQLNARVLANFGAFDYEFTQVDTDRDMFFATFIDYERLKGEKNKFAFKALIYKDGKISQDKVYLPNSRKETTRVMAAKMGHVLILDYNRKEKKVNLHLEKLNVNE